MVVTSYDITFSVSLKLTPHFTHRLHCQATADDLHWSSHIVFSYSLLLSREKRKKKHTSLLTNLLYPQRYIQLVNPLRSNKTIPFIMAVHRCNSLLSAALFMTCVCFVFSETPSTHVRTIIKDVVILGGGPSGSFAAVRLREDFGKSVIIVEQKDRLVCSLSELHYSSS